MSGKGRKAIFGALKGVTWTLVTFFVALIGELTKWKTARNSGQPYNLDRFFCSGEYLYIILAIAGAIIIDFAIDAGSKGNKEKYGPWAYLAHVLGFGILALLCFSSSSLLEPPVKPLDVQTVVADGETSFVFTMAMATLLKGIYFYKHMKLEAK